MRLADLPPARRRDVEEAPRFSIVGDTISCIDDITGCTYSEHWDESDISALAFAERSGEDTAWLVRNTPHYAWLRASR
jgi:hypothetical protein